MTARLPEITLGPEIREVIEQACEAPDILTRLERSASTSEPIRRPLLEAPPWRNFAEEVRREWKSSDHVIVRGAPALAEGASLFLLSLTLSDRFKTYRDGKVVKTFRMSPWTKDLSHTTREGDFHTDLNTEVEPPTTTGIQCLTPDPGAPQFGANRVARTSDLISYLEESGRRNTLRFLLETQVTMVNDRSRGAWTGRIVEGSRIRFHPATIRAAAARSGQDLTETDEHLAIVHTASLAVSLPFSLEVGDLFFVSNHRALHYRGECSVSFVDFPLEFQARSIHVLHQMSEP
ncbi:MAG TPA: TauD/TfdA family dioxygenase [Thermoanaerobaculia bacterium]|nr:TauD/TfdA family dioxygenase [Thermoanaerobaculia bacterium]